MKKPFGDLLTCGLSQHARVKCGQISYFLKDSFSLCLPKQEWKLKKDRIVFQIT